MFRLLFFHQKSMNNSKENPTLSILESGVCMSVCMWTIRIGFEAESLYLFFSTSFISICRFFSWFLQETNTNRIAFTSIYSIRQKQKNNKILLGGTLANMKMMRNLVSIVFFPFQLITNPKDESARNERKQMFEKKNTELSHSLLCSTNRTA